MNIPSNLLIYTLSFLLILNIIFVTKIIKLKKALNKIILSNNTLSKKEIDIHQENFIKFISDSRDWAFKYIEEVQTGINNFIKEVDHEIEYFDKYGNIIATPMNKPMEIISKSYKDLKKLVPENDKEQ